MLTLLVYKFHKKYTRVSYHISLSTLSSLRVHQPLLTYLLHGAETFLRSQPVNFAASQEIPRIYGTQKFLTVPTSARHLSLPWANSIQSPQPPPLQLPEDPF
jgi:hypothetical protein